jgi:hypothetical protein
VLKVTDPGVGRISAGSLGKEAREGLQAGKRGPRSSGPTRGTCGKNAQSLWDNASPIIAS